MSNVYETSRTASTCPEAGSSIRFHRVRSLISWLNIFKSTFYIMFMHDIKWYTLSCQRFEAPSRRVQGTTLMWKAFIQQENDFILLGWIINTHLQQIFLVWTTVYNINIIYHTCPSPRKTLDLNWKQENCSIKQICQQSDGVSPVQRGWRRLVRFKSYSNTLAYKTKRRRRTCNKMAVFSFLCPDVNSSLKRSLNAL